MWLWIRLWIGLWIGLKWRIRMRTKFWGTRNVGTRFWECMTMRMSKSGWNFIMSVNHCERNKILRMHDHENAWKWRQKQNHEEGEERFEDKTKCGETRFWECMTMRMPENEGKSKTTRREKNVSKLESYYKWFQRILRRISLLRMEREHKNWD